jgi:hypothetical protein
VGCSLRDAGESHSPQTQITFDKSRFSTFAHRGGRIIDTDTLRISVVLQVSSDDQEREQGSEDNPNVNAHQSSPAAAAFPANNSLKLTDGSTSTTCSAPTRRANHGPELATSTAGAALMTDAVPIKKTGGLPSAWCIHLRIDGSAESAHRKFPDPPATGRASS